MDSLLNMARIRRYSDVMTMPDSFIQRQQLDASMADTFLEHLCLLDIDQEPITARNTSIICTIGPASRSIPKLQEMVKAGMNIARLNFSHGSHEYHSETIKNIREAVETITSDPLCYRPVAIALDTKGPEIRTGLVKGKVDEEVELVKGRHVRVVTAESDKDKTDGEIIWVNYPSLHKVLQKGRRIYIDDGLLALRVIEIGELNKNPSQSGSVPAPTDSWLSVAGTTDTVEPYLKPFSPSMGFFQPLSTRRFWRELDLQRASTKPHNGPDRVQIIRRNPDEKVRVSSREDTEPPSNSSPLERLPGPASSSQIDP
ncbi:pyruvate kinase PKM-like [Nematolebias whitei]|uniref:pyruvate kinase PKM-like n=1 Tax=Nematolebias whitei TaxID=451745 RepID=UPI001896F73B|nr:pyruvate kinase PKM-like [Nematolebias whitei]